jgi:hypothetical protein
MAGAKSGHYAVRGAAAAAADLARARKAYGVDATAIDPILREAAVAVFRDADVFVRSLRTYDWEHPRVKDFHERLQNRLDEYLVETDELSVSLQPRALMLDTETVFEAPRVEDNPWFVLFADGIRRVTFKRGLDEIQTMGFFVTMRSLLNRGDGDIEYDSVTLLWERDFQHIEFVAIDSFVEGSGVEVEGASADALQDLVERCTRKELPGPELVGPAYAQGHVQRRSAEELTKAELAVLRAENLSVVHEVPKHARSVTFRLLEVNDDDREELAQACKVDPDEDGRYLGALLGALSERAASADGPMLRDSLDQLCTQLIRGGELRKARKALEHITATVPSAAALTEKLVSDEDVEHVVATAAANPNTHTEEDAFQLLAALSPGKAGALLRAAVRIADPTLRARVLAVAAPWGAAAAKAVGAVIGQATEPIARDLVALLGKIGGPSAADALGEASRTGAAGIRADAIAAYFAVASHADSARRAERGLREPSAPVRIASLDFLVRIRAPRAGAWIRGRLDDSGFAGLDFAERKRMYLGYAQLDPGKAAPWMLEQLSQRNTLGRAKVDEQRALAAWGLAHLRHRDAKPVLERIRAERMLHETLREACLHALEDIDKPAPAIAPPPVDPAQRHRQARAKRGTAPPAMRPAPRPDVAPARAPAPAAAPAPAPSGGGVDALLTDYLDKDER